MDEILKRDQNHVTVLGGITNDSDQDIVMLRVDPITKRLLVATTGGGGGSTSYESPASGLINGSNNVFVFTHTPIALVANGMLIFENDTGNVAGYYTLAGNTTTLLNQDGALILYPPSSLKGQYNA